MLFRSSKHKITMEKVLPVQGVSKIQNEGPTKIRLHLVSLHEQSFRFDLCK